MASVIDFVRLTDSQLETATIGDKFTTSESPKYKFTFYVKFKFRHNAPKHSGGDTANSNLLAIKQASRLTPVINYHDANYYGFRTKVATKVDFSVVNLTFYDDSSGRSHDIFEKYMQEVSPITNIENANAVSDSQTIGPLRNGSELGLIDNIEVYHYHKGGTTLYKYMNPKIVNIMLDELDMSVSDVTLVTLSFAYDAFNISHL